MNTTKAATSKPYSLSFNETEGQWIARVKKPDGAWKTKWLGNQFGPSDAWEAEQHLLSWYGAFLKEGGVTSPTVTIAPTGKTLNNMSERWLSYREADNTGTKINTLRGFKTSFKNWILDNPKFPHEKIAHLDIETEFTVDVTRKWIQSLGGSHSSRIQHIGALKSFFNDVIGNEWVSGEMVSPFDKKPIKKLIKHLSDSKRRNKVITVFTAADVVAVLSQPNNKVKDARRIRYLTGVATGLRKEEVQGLVWNDLTLGENPHVKVSRQLFKIGHSPFLMWEELARTGSTKAQVVESEQALMTEPKAHSDRWVPLHPLLLEALKWWKRKGWAFEVGRKPEGSDPVFPRNKVSLKDGQLAGDFSFINDASATLRLDLKRLKLPLLSNGKPLTIHSFRHTFATMLEEAGVSQERRDHLLGHKPRTVAASNYVAKNMATYAADIARLPLGELLTLSRDTVTTASDTSATIL